MNVTRRSFLTRLGFGTLAAAGALSAGMPVKAACQRVSGAGSYRIGPYNPLENGGEPVYLTTELGFDETMVFCKIVTNFAGFYFPTARMGTVALGVHEFQMAMSSTSIADMKVTLGTDGPVASFAGVMRSETTLFNGAKQVTFIEENISFDCDSTELDQAVRTEISKLNFSMTVRFNPLKEHAAIFGETPTFAGHLTQGNIIVAL